MRQVPAAVAMPVERTEMGECPCRIVTAGRIAGLYGVQGWVKVLSYTEPPELLLQSSLWQVCLGGQWQGLMLSAWRRHGKAYIASLESYDVREKSISLVGADIGLLREQLPAAGPGEYYWADLIGLKVYSRSGALLGVVDHLLETG